MPLDTVGRFVEGDNFDLIYKELLRRLLGSPVVRARGIPAREQLFTGYVLTDVKQSTIDFTATQAHARQPVYDAYAKAEIEWYKSGNLQASSAPSKFWLKLADKDGEIVSNYGHMILREVQYEHVLCDEAGCKGSTFETAFDHIVRILTDDRDSRKAIMHYSTPDRLHNPLDTPCTLTAQVLIRDEALHMIVNQRSGDIILGLPYDTPWHCWLMHELASALRVKTGTLYHAVGSLHLYETNVELATKICTPDGW